VSTCESLYWFIFIIWERGVYGVLGIGVSYTRLNAENKTGSHVICTDLQQGEEHLRSEIATVQQSFIKRILTSNRAPPNQQPNPEPPRSITTLVRTGYVTSSFKATTRLRQRVDIWAIY
jgi:hypothetical protein